MWRDSTDLAETGDLSDEALMARVVLRDEVAFMTVYDRYADGLFGTSVRFVRDRELAAEIVQDAFLAAWRKADQFDPRSGSLIGWLLGIARNRGIDRLRSEARRPAPAWTMRNDGRSSDVDSGWPDGPRSQAAPLDADPAVELDRRWVRSVVRSTVADLAPEEQRILVLAYDLGLSQSEIAERLELPLGTVKSRTRRALARLRHRLESVPDLRTVEWGESGSSGGPPGSDGIRAAADGFDR